MTNIMREKPLERIRRNARAFVEKCLESGGKSVDVYVYSQHPQFFRLPDMLTDTSVGPPPLLRPGLRHSFHVQPRRHSLPY